MIDAEQLRVDVIRPTLAALSMPSRAAENLLLGTAAVESRLGSYLRQVGGGPALGIWQCEPATHDDIWENYLRLRGPLRDTVRRLAPPLLWSDNPVVMVKPDALIASHWYAAAICRLHYRRYPEPMPAEDDWRAMAELWKARYNTAAGAGTVEKFLAAAKACKVMP